MFSFFYLGGGTFDVTVAMIKAGAIEVKAIAGDNHLGGQDMDNRLVKHIMKEFKNKTGKDMSGNPRAVRKLRTCCERAKRILSFDFETEIESVFEGVCLLSTVTRAKFEDLNMDLFIKCMDLVDSCLSDAKMEKNSVDEVVLVGGLSRIPKVQRMLQELFGEKVVCKESINPDEAVAYGAAVLADKLWNEVDKEEIERMIGDAEKHKLEDNKFGKKVKVRYDLEDYAYNTIDAIRNATKITSADKKKMDDAFESFKKWLESNKHAEVDDFKHKKKEL